MSMQRPRLNGAVSLEYYVNCPPSVFLKDRMLIVSLLKDLTFTLEGLNITGRVGVTVQPPAEEYHRLNGRVESLARRIACFNPSRYGCGTRRRKVREFQAELSLILSCHKRLREAWRTFQRETEKWRRFYLKSQLASPAQRPSGGEK